MTAKLEAEAEELADNRTIVVAMADEMWTRHILDQCVNQGNTALDASIDTSEVSVEGSATEGVTFSSDLYDEDELFVIKMSVIGANDFWSSDTISLAEVQANILFDSGYTYSEVEEALALVDFSEVNHALLASMSAKNTSQEGYNV